MCEAGVPGKGQSQEASAPAEVEGEEERVYEYFDPLLMQQHVSRLHMQFATFDGALDEFFSKVLPLAHTWVIMTASVPSERCRFCARSQAAAVSRMVSDSPGKHTHTLRAKDRLLHTLSMRAGQFQTRAHWPRWCCSWQARFHWGPYHVVATATVLRPKLSYTGFSALSSTDACMGGTGGRPAGSQGAAGPG